MIVTRDGERVRIGQQPYSVTYVSGNYFSALGVSMERGRGFLPEEDRTGAPEAVAVLDYRTWQSQFGGDPAILGRVVRLDEIPFTVVGVASRDFRGTSSATVGFLDTVSGAPAVAPARRGRDGLPDQARPLLFGNGGTPRAGYSRQQATAEMELLVRQFRRGGAPGPASIDPDCGHRACRDARRNRDKAAPIAGLLFPRSRWCCCSRAPTLATCYLRAAAARRSEIAVRLALGGSRLRLIRHY